MKVAKVLLKLFALLCVIVLMLISYALLSSKPSYNDALCPESDFECRTGNKLDYFPTPSARSYVSENDAIQQKSIVALALSGGGSRAANFSWAVMQLLDDYGILQHVNVISSTSGGGLPAAYYALNGPTPDWRKAKELFATNFRDKWLWSMLNPVNIAKFVFTDFDRSDLMSDIFSAMLFNTANYKSLDSAGPDKLVWIANATAVNQRTGLFPFTQENFAKFGARLDTYPISKAVMASAAFPGAFNSMTLKAYPLAPPPRKNEKQMKLTKNLPRSYIHLLDGGASDNLGIESALQYAASVNNIARKKGKADKPCLLLIVDSFAEGISHKLDFRSDPRDLSDYIVDFNFTQAFDVFLNQRRSKFLTSSGLQSIDGYIGQFGPVWESPPGFYSRGITVTKHTSEILVPLYASPNEFISSQVLERELEFGPARLLTSEQKSLKAQKKHEIAQRYFSCQVWHISIDNIASIRVYDESQDGSKYLEYQDGNERLEYLVKLFWTASQIKTNFNLVGPNNCTSKYLQDVLYAAANVVVRENTFSRATICDWMKSNDLPTSNMCKTKPESLSMNSFPLSIASNSPTIYQEYRAHQAVACLPQ